MTSYNDFNEWQTPTLSDIRTLVRDSLSSAGIILVPNDWPQLIGDSNAFLASLNLQYLDYLSLQILPLTASGDYLDKWATLYLVNSDGTIGRKVASYSSGTATITANNAGTVLPAGTLLTAGNGSAQSTFQTISATAISGNATSFAIRSLTPGAAANLTPGTGLTLVTTVNGINTGSAVVVQLSGGADIESDDAVRARVLNRLANTPMSGSSNDYEVWALAVPGCTRAWCSPNAVGYGTVTVRVMFDQLRATSDPLTSGLPWAVDLQAVYDAIMLKRPVTVSEVYVEAPLLSVVNVTIANLNRQSTSVQQAIETSLANMIAAKARPAQAINGTIRPAQTIYASMMSQAISQASGVRSFELLTPDYVPANGGCMAVFGKASFPTQ